MSKVSFQHVFIRGVCTVVPEKKINIDEELHFYDNDEKKLNRIKKILGLGTRHIVQNGETLTDLCLEAGQNLLDELSYDKAEIDCLIVASTSHDYAYPASACILQEKLGLSEECACFDISGLACSAYVYALWLAHSLITAGSAKKVLLLAGDTVSLRSDVRNRNSNMLFGDAGTATILEYSEKIYNSSFLLGTRGADWNKIVAPASGLKLPVRADIAHVEIEDNAHNVWHLWDEIMRGMHVFQFTGEIAPKSIEELLEFSNIKKEDVDFFAFHQGNKQIVETILKHSQIDFEKSSTQTFTKYGNCATASVVTVLCDQLFDKKYSHVMLGSFGVGLSWSFALISLHDSYNGGIKIMKKRERKSRAELINAWTSYFKNEHEEFVE